MSEFHAFDVRISSSAPLAVGPWRCIFPCMTSHTFADAGRALERVLDVSAPLLATITDREAIESRPSGKWSRKEILGHLIDSASNNHQRFVRGVQDHGGDYPSYDQDSCVTLQRPNEVAWSVLLGLWSNYNRYLAHVIAGLPPEAAGYSMQVGDNPVVDLLWVAIDYVEHLKHHLNQILGPRFDSTYPGTPFPHAPAAHGSGAREN